MSALQNNAWFRFSFLFLWSVGNSMFFKLHRLLVTSLHIGYELLNKPIRKIGMVETFFVCVKEQHYLLMVCRQFYDFQLHRLLTISKQGNLRLIFDGRLVMYLYTCVV